MQPGELSSAHDCITLHLGQFYNTHFNHRIDFPIGNGYIPTSCLKEILKELDGQLTNEELDMMIEEIDSDGSGTVDFDGTFRTKCDCYQGSYNYFDFGFRIFGDDDWLG